MEAEASLLRSRGNVVVPYYKSNEALGAGRWQRRALRLFGITGHIGNLDCYCKESALI